MTCLVSKLIWPQISIIYFAVKNDFLSPTGNTMFLLVHDPCLPKIYFHAKFQEDTYKTGGGGARKYVPGNMSFFFRHLHMYGKTVK